MLGLVLGDLGDGASRAGVDAGRAANASVAVNDGGSVLNLDNAHRASVCASAAAYTLINFNYGMHSTLLCVVPQQQMVFAQ